MRAQACKSPRCSIGGSSWKDLRSLGEWLFMKLKLQLRMPKGDSAALLDSCLQGNHVSTPVPADPWKETGIPDQTCLIL